MLVILLVCGIGVVAALVPVVQRWQELNQPPPFDAPGEPGAPSAPAVGDSPARQAGPVTRTTAVSQPARSVYRHSVVPGGVHTPTEVADAMFNDPVVARHYADLDPSRLRQVQLTQPLVAHVSYRLDDKVYWTQRQLRLAEGEAVLTDGTTMLRARCGNMVSTMRRTPTFAGEPEEVEFDQIEEPGRSFRPRKPSPPDEPPPSTKIPEPSTLLLAGLAIAATAAYLQRRSTLR